MIKSGMSWVAHVEEKCKQGFALGHLKERHYLKGLGKDETIIFIRSLILIKYRIS